MVSEAKSLVGIAVIRAGVRTVVHVVVHIAANALEPVIVSGQGKR